MNRALRCGALVALLAAGCGEKTTTPPPEPSPSPSTVEDDAPVDELADTELAEGRATGFGFPFPAVMRVSEPSNLRVAAAGPVRLEDAANYVRARIDAAQTETGPGKTVFDRVTIKDPKGPPEERKSLVEGDDVPAEQAIRIEVSTTKRGWTEIVVTRSLRAKAPPGLTQDQRWERLGVRKDGKPADPKKFE